MLLLLDHLGVLFFAISGMLTAADRNLDVFGGYIIAFITALGGGTIRDLLLNIDIAWMGSLTHVLTVFLGGTLGILFRHKLKNLRRTFFIFDTMGIAFFTIVGVQKGLNHEQIPVTAMFLGMISATFGGLLRDVLCNEIPLIFRKEIYAIPCLAGGAVYLLGDYAGFGGETWLLWSSVAFIALFRTFAVIFSWEMPLIKDLN
ncbi:MAG: trimeric intracellular cation channel family protein [Brumimicrobium sp.]|nr:trimeric intracellular cation channel family protein [Brumimicrobium sp.]